MIETSFMTNKQFEKMMDEMIEFTAENISEEEEMRQKKSIEETLKKISTMLSSKGFERKCKEQAKKYGVNEKYIKNTYAGTILNKIGEVTGNIIEFVGEAFCYLVRLVSYVLQKIMDFAVSALSKLVNILTSTNEAII